MDPLSDILALLRPRTVDTYGLLAGGEWALDFPRGYVGIKFGALARGFCWLKVQGEAHPIRLEAGDCYLLTGQPYWLGSDTALSGIDARCVFVDAATRVGRHGDTEELFLIGGRLTFDDSHMALLTGVLPAAMHIPANCDEAIVLRWTLDRLAKELTEARPGGVLLAEHHAQILFIHALRAHLGREADGPPSWLMGLNDLRIARALTLMHGAPAARWTVERLAREVGMSRTAFALRFKALVGWAPVDYLTRWRMRLAARDLSRGEISLSGIASAVGYESDTAFSIAFKRIMGCPPRSYRRQGQPPS
jgi:AraC-like DNA-binding protein